MAPDENRDAAALRELESIRFLHLFADRKLIRHHDYVAAARQLESRGRLAQWSAIIGAGCFAGRAVVALITGVAPWDTLNIAMTAVTFGLALVVAASGVRLRRRTAGVRSRVESLLSQRPGEGDAASTA